MKLARMLITLGMLILMVGCGQKPLNNPYPKSESHENIYYSSFTERPKTLDPARSYSSNEYQFISQILEPPLQYHYLKRPFTLIPLTSTTLPSIRTEKIADKEMLVYRIELQPGRYYAPHPAFALQTGGKHWYWNINEDYLNDHDINTLSDFAHTGTRELIADDYIYEIKRIASPKTQSPILGFMSEHIYGLDQFSETLQDLYKKHLEKNGEDSYFDIRKISFPGVRKIDRYTFEIVIKDNYPQFIYWLAMPFFSPVPWEVDRFYSQPGMDDKNITFDWFPVGTGAYELTENNPNSEMILIRNPNAFGERYPVEGEPEDAEQGLLVDAGKSLPFIDKAVFRLEKEAVPRWNKFLQGYYDNSAISSDSFDQAIAIDNYGQAHLTPLMQERGIHLYTSVSPSIFYLGFNMLDDVVGGNSERARQLRQAIGIALDFDEYISIFMNGRGTVAQGPIPPGIFGYQEGPEGVNPYVYSWNNARLQRLPLTRAKQLLAEAGYPEGRHYKTGQPLILYYDVPASSGPDDKAMFDWMRKQFAKLGIQLQVRATQYNRFQEKMRTGNAQLFFWGWHADYPDPENFLFLLYGPNGKVKYQGENAANYQNAEFDSLFEKMKQLPNGDERAAVIHKMLEIVQKDSPWVWGFHPQTFVLSHQWNRVSKPNEIANNTLKYARFNPEERETLRLEWNQPKWWPLGLVLLVFVICLLPVAYRYWKEEYRR